MRSFSLSRTFMTNPPRSTNTKNKFLSLRCAAKSAAMKGKEIQILVINQVPSRVNTALIVADTLLQILFKKIPLTTEKRVLRHQVF